MIEEGADIVRPARRVRRVPIVLQTSKVASDRIFGETLKRKTIDDSDSLSRVIEAIDEFSVKR